MDGKSVREKSIEKVRLLRNPVISAAFAHYFEQNWQVKQLLQELKSAGADIGRLREWALYSFHPLGTDEAEEKLKRGQMMQDQLKKALVGYESAIDFFSIYASAPHFNWPETISVSIKTTDLVKLNQYLAREARTILERVAKTSVYNTKRLGVNWQGSYLYLSKAYIGQFMKWDERKILGAMSHLTAAAHESVKQRIPHNLRALLRKALRSFESDPRNTTIIVSLRKAASDPNVLSKSFPPLSPNSG
jgi:hypothetical protein